MHTRLHERHLVRLNLLTSGITVAVHLYQRLRPARQRVPLPIEVLKLGCYLLKLVHRLASFLYFLEW